MTNPFQNSFRNGGNNGPVIENEAAWEAGRKARIVNNARTTWMRNDPTREALEQRLFEEANFRGPDSFAAKMIDALSNWGKLSEKQEAAVRGMFAKADA